MKVNCPHCNATLEARDEVPELPEALGFDCPTCCMYFVVAKLPSGVRAIAATRTRVDPAHDRALARLLAADEAEG